MLLTFSKRYIFSFESSVDPCQLASSGTDIHPCIEGVCVGGGGGGATTGLTPLDPPS